MADIGGTYLDGSSEFLVDEVDGEMMATGALRCEDGTTAEVKLATVSQSRLENKNKRYFTGISCLFFIILRFAIFNNVNG